MGLTKQDLVDAALAELDDVGLDKLTVRGVARRLDVQAPALYWHVKSKQDLLDEAGTEIWRRIGADLAVLPADLPWRESLTAFAQAIRRHLLAHRDGARTFSGTYMTDDDVLRGQGSGIARLQAQGFSVRDVVRAVSLLHHFTIGFCIEEQAVRQDAERYDLERRNERVAGDDLATEVGAEIFAAPADERFADLVALLLDSVERLIARE